MMKLLSGSDTKAAKEKKKPIKYTFDVIRNMRVGEISDELPTA